MARRRKSKKFKIPGVSFSWKRALGITKAKRTFARKTGIPTTKAGRQRKLGRMMTGGCLMPMLFTIAVTVAVIGLITQFILSLF